MPSEHKFVAGRVSVVMACFNAERFVAEAVRSVVGQTYRDVELIVVDDGSTDRSREILAGMQGQLTLIEQDNAGPYPARNRGLAAASGEYVAFLDADDWWDAEFVASMTEALEASSADAAYCGWQNVGVPGPRGDPYVPPDYLDGDPVEEFLKNCPWPIHAALVRRSVIDRLGGFSERMFSSMDFDLWIRMLAVTRKMVRVPRVLAYYRWHGSGQISATRWRQVLNARQVRRDFVAANPTLVAHLDRAQVIGLVDGVLLHAGYEAFWRRDLDGAQQLFRKALGTGCWSRRDLKYLLASLLPARLFKALAGTADARRMK
jgi:GT2 family glycosyltransferase